MLNLTLHSALVLITLAMVFASLFFFKRLDRHASRDGLTGLENRRIFSAQVRKQIKAADRKTAGLGILIIDLDKFKHINDILGHAAGDEILIQVANRLEVIAEES